MPPDLQRLIPRCRVFEMPANDVVDVILPAARAIVTGQFADPQSHASRLQRLGLKRQEAASSISLLSSLSGVGGIVCGVLFLHSCVDLSVGRAIAQRCGEGSCIAFQTFAGPLQPVGQRVQPLVLKTPPGRH